MKHVASRGGRTKSALWTILGILAELMLTAAAICALYIAWQMWWTGVQSEHNQIETRQSVSWSDPGKSAGEDLEYALAVGGAVLQACVKHGVFVHVGHECG